MKDFGIDLDKPEKKETSKIELALDGEALELFKTQKRWETRLNKTLIAVMVTYLAVAWYGAARDNKGETIIDDDTGCKYLSYNGAMTPRIAADGVTHVGCKDGAK